MSDQTEAIPRTILFAHILNEELLLPCWLHHHKKLFQHGVIINCMSTDRSVEIIKQICPTWEIFDTKNTPGVDILGIEKLEEKYTGWKMALNVSEFLIIDNLDKYIQKLEQKGVIGVRSTGVIIVDRPNEFDIKQFEDDEFIYKKDYGYFEQGKAWNGDSSNLFATTEETFRSRLFHRNHNGRYTSGRHNTELDVEIDPELFVAWIGRGSPELYLHRCNVWSNPPNGITLWGETGKCFSWYSEKSQQFWESENQKSQNLFELSKLYFDYIHHLKSLLRDTSNILNHSKCIS